MTTTTITDTKAGFCGMCRRGQHAICGSDDCRCDAKGHRNRPSVTASTRERSRGNGTPPPGPKKLTEPAWGLVRADPPEREKKPARPTVVELARPLLERIMAEGAKEWHRLALFPKPLQGSYVAAKLRAAYPKSEWEFKAAKLVEVGQSAVYARWLGTEPKTL